MNIFHSSPCRAPLLIMLSFAVSRSFCQLFTETSRRSYPTFASLIRTYTTSSPKCGETKIDDDASVVTYGQLKSMLSKNNIQLFDVRNPDEYEAGRIPQAVNVPLDILEESLNLSPEKFQKKFEAKAPGKEDDNIVFHCRSGVRSSSALTIARQLGFSRARHLRGGYAGWVEQEGSK